MNSGQNPRGPQNAPDETQMPPQPRRQLPFGLPMPDDPRIFLSIGVVALWLLINAAMWIVNNLVWPSYLFIRALDTATGAAALPGAPFVVWTIWGGVFGGLLGNWLLAPLYGERENRAWPLYLAVLGMLLIAALLWGFVR